MSYRLQFSKHFVKSLENLPGDLRAVTRAQIRNLADDPRPTGAKELDGHPGYYRLWLPRHHRLVYKISDEDQIILLLYIGPKTNDLYDDLGLGRHS